MQRSQDVTGWWLNEEEVMKNQDTGKHSLPLALKTTVVITQFIYSDSVVHISLSPISPAYTKVKKNKKKKKERNTRERET